MVLFTFYLCLSHVLLFFIILIFYYLSHLSFAYYFPILHFSGPCHFLSANFWLLLFILVILCTSYIFFMVCMSLAIHSYCILLFYIVLILFLDKFILVTKSILSYRPNTRKNQHRKGSKKRIHQLGADKLRIDRLFV